MIQSPLADYQDFIKLEKGFGEQTGAGQLELLLALTGNPAIKVPLQTLRKLQWPLKEENIKKRFFANKILHHVLLGEAAKQYSQYQLPVLLAPIELCLFEEVRETVNDAVDNIDELLLRKPADLSKQSLARLGELITHRALAAAQAKRALRILARQSKAGQQLGLETICSLFEYERTKQNTLSQDYLTLYRGQLKFHAAYIAPAPPNPPENEYNKILQYIESSLTPLAIDHAAIETLAAATQHGYTIHPEHEVILVKLLCDPHVGASRKTIEILLGHHLKDSRTKPSNEAKSIYEVLNALNEIKRKSSKHIIEDHVYKTLIDYVKSGEVLPPYLFEVLDELLRIGLEKKSQTIPDKVYELLAELMLNDRELPTDFMACVMDVLHEDKFA